ncbi:MAG: phosphoribosylglycinamide formyltransferase [Fulvivirga sp.]
MTRNQKPEIRNQKPEIRNQKPEIRIAVFASGNGSNAENIIKYFKPSTHIQVSLVLTNNPDAFVLERAQKLSVPSLVFSREELINTERILQELKNNDIDFIVLAGFLLMIPANLITAYPDRIINIHPALLPKYGGKGMYGDIVHKAVRNADDIETGITIHFVNKRYDEGTVIFQATCPVTATDTPEMIAQKVHSLEYKHYPQVIESVIKKLIKNP